MTLLLSADDRVRVPLAKLGVKPRADYQADLREDGTIILTPVTVIPTRELELWRDEALRASVMRGLTEAADGLAQPDAELDQLLDELEDA
ncbi:MAG: hypothetical protein LBK28_04995 [Propionibacteriaceae bacterium]|jgi:hypothetical protein|nr:hypothetical protein [Propionibacteriaceae bacterium]